MSIELIDFQGDPNIGLFLVSTNKFILVPADITNNLKRTLEATFKVPLIEIVFDTKIIGALISANDNGIVVSHLIHDNVIEEIKNKLPDIKIGKIKTGYFAMGNLIAGTNKQTLISPLIESDERKMIRDVLDTELIATRLSGSDLIGSLLKITTHGGVISPIVDDESEIENLISIFNLELESSTVNRGFQFPSGGIEANSFGAVLGNLTTGIESIAITRGLFPN
ncbi:MAG: Translation initiation factor 6 [Candidatus Heimdallarchaeota archaeon LC_3]|nr:MAG: Translation initiation factor 6 [Candidatus Heimdallarchaeota archaeon LC_3]